MHSCSRLYLNPAQVAHIFLTSSPPLLLPLPLLFSSSPSPLVLWPLPSADPPPWDSPTLFLLSIRLPLIFSLMWWYGVIWGSRLGGKGRGGERGERDRMGKKIREKQQGEGLWGWWGSFFFFPILCDTNISFNSPSTFTYEKKGWIIRHGWI